MEIETSLTIVAVALGIVAVAAVVLIVFLIKALIAAQQTLESTKKDLHHLSSEAIAVMQKIDALTADIKAKSESLNFVFHPLKTLNKSRKQSGGTMNEVADWLGMTLDLFDKLKAVVRHYAK